MRTDYTSRIAAVMLAALFLSNDVLASARALQQGFIPVRRVSVVGASSAPGLHPFNPVNVEDHTRQEATNQDQVAYMGGHPNDLHNRSEDDVFDLELDLSQAKYQYAYLSYEVKGIENPEALPKSLNGGRTYGSATLNSSPSNQWKLARVRVSMDDLVDGNNALQFSIPDDLYYPVEVRNVNLTLTEEPEEQRHVQRSIDRKIASTIDFQVMDSTATLQGFVATEVEIASIPNFIKNVTRNAQAYQLDGESQKAYHVAMGVNSRKLQTQSELNQVQIYYFDKITKSWKAAHTIKVDFELLRVEAMVPGETDYFAGMIQSPDMPQANAFVPTNVSDIEPANPAAGMRLMQAPQINRMGSAALNYPLWIPQGRNGMTPSLAVSYNSDAGTGWMGLGWNIGGSSISVDTKWGVPEYDATYETEPYILDGEALFHEGESRPNRPKFNHLDEIDPQRRATSTTRFFPRVVSSYFEIKRHNTNTDDYFWTVTDASQTTKYYGTINGTTLDTNSILTTSGGDIAKWYLKRVEDKWGNTIDYTYRLHSETSTSGSLKTNGQNRILEKITYTGHLDGGVHTTGKYEVRFHTSDNRGDARIMMNYGLKVVDDRILDSVTVHYNSTSLVTYSFDYKNSSTTFYKTLLTSIQEHRGGSLFYEHKLDYYEDAIGYDSGQIIDLGRPDPWLKPSGTDPDVINRIRGAVLTALSPSSLNTSLTRGFSVGGRFGIGPSPDLKQDKTSTFGVGLNYSLLWNSTTRSMRDVNGDGIPDAIFEDYDDNMAYTAITFDKENGFSVEPYRNFETSGIERSRTSSFNTSANYVAPGTAATVGLNWNTSTSHTQRTLTDYNADGIPDLIIKENDKAVIKFGVLQYNNDLEFTRSSEHTYNSIVKGVDFTLPDEEPIKEFQIVKVWKAPLDGTVNITGNPNVSTDAKGVCEVAIQKNSSFLTSGFLEVDSTTTPNITQSSVSVSKGDLILFRVRSGEDGQEDLLEWNPQVAYTTSITDGTGNNIGTTNTTQGFLLSGRDEAVVMADEEFKIDLNLDVTAGKLGDDIFLNLHISKNGEPFDVLTGKFSASNASFSPGTDLTNLGINSSGVGTFQNFVDFYTGSGMSVSSSDTMGFRFEMHSSSNPFWENALLRPIVTFGEDCHLETEQYPLVDYKVYNEVLKHDVERNRPSVSTYTYEVVPQITLDTNDIDSIFDYSTEDEEGLVYMTVKTNGTYLSRVAIRFERDASNANNNKIEMHPVNTTDGTVDESTVLVINAMNNVTSIQFTGSQIVNNKLDVEFHADGPAAKKLAEYMDEHLFRIRFMHLDGNSVFKNLTVGGTNPQRSIYYRQWHELGFQHKSWGRFAWSPANAEASTSAIDTADLHDPLQDIVANETFDYTDSTALYNNRTDVNLMDFNFFMLTPTRGERTQSLRSYHDNLNPSDGQERYSIYGSYMAEYAHKSSVSPGYLGEVENEISEIDEELGVDPNYTANGILGYNRSNTLGATAKVIGIGPSAYIPSSSTFFSRDKDLFVDVNGDRYPDILNETNDQVSIYFTDQLGGHQSAVSSHNFTDQLNKSISSGVTFGLSSTDFINTYTLFSAEDESYPSILETLKLGTGFSLGSSSAKHQFFDINGDGLSDQFMDGGSPEIKLNTGVGVENNAVSVNGLEQSRWSIDVSKAFDLTSAAQSSAEHLEEIADAKNPKKDRSWDIGLGLNFNSSQAEKIYFDINGDGLQDYLSYNNTTNDDIKIFLNDGDNFHEYMTVSTDPLSTEINTSSAIGASGNLTWTGAFSGAVVKISGTVVGSGNLSVNRLHNTFMDMNGDGVPDIVVHKGQSDVEVFVANYGKANLLKSVTNPLSGSFTIDYDSEGKKRGYRKPQIETHMSVENNEHILWDMPQGKFVMTSVTVHDSLDIKEGAVDLDGEDSFTTYFLYDGGIHSRREREFIGFTRIATRSESHIDEHTGEKYLADFCRSNSIEARRHKSEIEIIAPFSAMSDSTDVKTGLRYNMNIQDYTKPKGSSPADMQAFLYTADLIKSNLQVHVHEWRDSIDICNNVTKAPNTECSPIWWKYDLKYTALISESKPTYELRNVDTDPLSSNMGQVIPDGDNWSIAVPKLLNETSTIFPAVTNTQKTDFPEVDVQDKYFANKVDLTYDKYFNVTRAEQNGGGVTGVPDTIPVDTIVVVRYVERTQLNNCDTLSLLRVAYDDGALIGYEVPSKDPTFEDAIVWSVYDGNNCIPDSIELEPVLCAEGDTAFLSKHRKEIVDTIILYDVQFNAIYNGNLIAVMTYFAPGSAAQQTNVLESHKVYETNTSSGNLRRHTRVNALHSSLAPDDIRHYLTNTIHATDYAGTDITYNKYGLVTETTGAKNHKGQRPTVTFDYDTQVHQFVERVTNQFGEFACTEYDYGYQQVLQSVDVNGHPMRYIYDDKQRVKSIWAPREIANTTNGPTISFEYYPEGNSSISTTHPTAYTYHNTSSLSTSVDYSGDTTKCGSLISTTGWSSTMTNKVTTVTITDGIDRVVQVQTLTDWDDPATDTVHTMVDKLRTTGIAEINKFGLTTTQRNDTLSADTELGKIIDDQTLGVGEVKYDYAMRPVHQTLPWSDVSGSTEIISFLSDTLVYQWEGNLFVQSSDNSHTLYEKFIDGWGRTVKQTADDVGGPLTESITQFEYDNLGQNIRVIDPVNDTTTYVYDHFGRVSSEEHPDRGLTEMTYDFASNVTAIETPGTGSGSIDMIYDYSRLVKKTYPINDSLYNVRFTYGSFDDGNNGAGRIIKVLQGDSAQPVLTHYLKYDELGQNSYSRKVIAIAQSSGYRSFIEKHRYDSFGRALRIVYADNDEVNYLYTDLGSLKQITSKNNSVTTDIISEMSYDGYDNLVYQKYGNGTETEYNYHAHTRMLMGSGVDAIPDTNAVFVDVLDRTYRYNNRGMISSLERDVHSELMGIYDTEHRFDYTYDGLNRLSETDFDFTPVSGVDYSLDMTYDKAGSILTKDGSTSVAPMSSQDLDYDLTYTYQSGSPHQIKSIYDATASTTTTVDYNTSGSITKLETKNAFNAVVDRVKHVWTEEQWLRADSNDLGVHHYVYDYTGERMMKSEFTKYSLWQDDDIATTVTSMGSYVLYVSPYFVQNELADGVQSTKHYYMGMTRVASDISLEETYEGPGGSGSSKTANFKDPVIQDMAEVLRAFGFQEGTDFTVEGLKEAPTLAEVYPEYANSEEFKVGEGEGFECCFTGVRYWYHPDYLGSVDMVTNGSGEVHQFFMRNPWGEDMYEYYPSNDGFNSPYRFNGKEQDEETGLHYYGARYYQNKLGIWLSVDPLAHEFQTLTPYHFVANNPISIVDPNGMDTTFASDADRQFVNDLIDPNSSTYDPEFASMVDDLASSDKTYHFQSVAYEPNSHVEAGWTGIDPSDGAIVIAFTKSDNPNISTLGGSSYSALREETYHAWDYEMGGLDFDNPTATNEAEAWQFAASESGLIDYRVETDQNGSYKSYTPYYRIRNATTHQVALWLKNGMPSVFMPNGWDVLEGYGVPTPDGGIQGVYRKLPLK